MSDESDIRHEIALVAVASDYLPALQNAIRLWADSLTAANSSRRHDLLRDKQRAVAAFFRFAAKHPADVTAQDVKHWQAEMERSDEAAGKRGLKPASIYVRTSHLSSFYRWVMRHPQLSPHIGENPALLARPKASRAYQTESVKSWTDEELQKLIAVVRKKAEAGEVVGKRDLALLLLFMATGMRREEVSHFEVKMCALMRPLSSQGGLRVETIGAGKWMTRKSKKPCSTI